MPFYMYPALHFYIPMFLTVVLRNIYLVLFQCFLWELFEFVLFQCFQSYVFFGDVNHEEETVINSLGFDLLNALLGIWIGELLMRNRDLEPLKVNKWIFVLHLIVLGFICTFSYYCNELFYDCDSNPHPFPWGNIVAPLWTSAYILSFIDHSYLQRALILNAFNIFVCVSIPFQSSIFMTFVGIGLLILFWGILNFCNNPKEKKNHSQSGYG